MELMRRERDMWDPFDLLSDLQTDLNRVFFRSLGKRDDGWTKGFQPHIEVREETGQYILQADVPGLKKEDFSISVEGNTMTLKGERKQVKEQKEKGSYYSERVYGAFVRTMDFPTEIQADKVRATYKDGVLEVNLPKSESSKAKEIAVEVK